MANEEESYDAVYILPDEVRRELERRGISIQGTDRQRSARLNQALTSEKVGVATRPSNMDGEIEVVSVIHQRVAQMVNQYRDRRLSQPEVQAITHRLKYYDTWLRQMSSTDVRVIEQITRVRNHVRSIMGKLSQNSEVQSESVNNASNERIQRSSNNECSNGRLTSNVENANQRRADRNVNAQPQSQMKQPIKPIGAERRTTNTTNQDSGGEYSFQNRTQENQTLQELLNTMETIDERIAILNRHRQSLANLNRNLNNVTSQRMPTPMPAARTEYYSSTMAETAFENAAQSNSTRQLINRLRETASFLEETHMEDEEIVSRAEQHQHEINRHERQAENTYHRQPTDHNLNQDWDAESHRSMARSPAPEIRDNDHRNQRRDEARNSRIRKQIPVNQWRISFSGESSSNKYDLQIHEFLQQVKLFQRAENISDNDLLGEVAHLLNGRARKWYLNNFNRINSWLEFEREIKREFLPYGHNFALLSEIDRYKQSAGQPIGAFLTEIESKYNALTINIDEEQKLYTIQKNLSPAYAAAVATADVQTIEGLRHICKRIDSVQPATDRNVRRPGNDNQRSRNSFSARPRNQAFVLDETEKLDEETENSENDEDEPEIFFVKRDLAQAKRKQEADPVKRKDESKSKPTTNRTCFSCDKPGHGWKECPEPREKIFCYRCGNKGIRSFECKRCQGNAQSPSNEETRASNKTE